MQKLALITGASSGIGAEAARELARAGMRVVLVARDEGRLAAVADSIGGSASFEVCDASSGEAVLELARRIRRSHGVPDVVVNCAGLGQWKRIEDTDPSEALRMIGAPYLAAFNMTHAFMRDMLERRSGILVHVNSPACYMAWPGAVGYTAARAALRGLHEALRQDLVGTGVRSCHVVFGKVASGYFEHNPGAEAHMPGIANTIRTLTPEECGRVLAEVVRRPRHETIHPFLLRVYRWNHAVAPWLVRWLLLKTGARRTPAGQ
ncbi:MAG TPA: SDR family oxidoreductase [Quisquiliibacterium sp.]|nr:SDR family oxidoreductase [Quisquiliibacterium sp.]